MSESPRGSPCSESNILVNYWFIPINYILAESTCSVVCNYLKQLRALLEWMCAVTKETKSTIWVRCCKMPYFKLFRFDQAWFNTALQKIGVLNHRRSYICCHIWLYNYNESQAIQFQWFYLFKSRKISDPVKIMLTAEAGRNRRARKIHGVTCRPQSKNSYAILCKTHLFYNIGTYSLHQVLLSFSLSPNSYGFTCKRQICTTVFFQKELGDCSPPAVFWPIRGLYS